MTSSIRQRVRQISQRRAAQVAVCWLVAAIGIGTMVGSAWGQYAPPERLLPPTLPGMASGGVAPQPAVAGPPGGPASADTGQMVVDVIVRGQQTLKDHEIHKYIHTRKDREFDPDLVQADVRRLVTSGLFKEVKPLTQQTPSGVVVIFEVVERPRIGQIKFLGNRGFSDKKLLKEIGVKAGDPLNTYMAQEARRKLEEFYHRGGYPQATVSIFEGDRPGDRDLVFLINEGQLERLASVMFEGNQSAPASVLKTKIQSKPGYLWYLFRGKVDREKIDADVQALTAYYRSLGYFQARVSRVLEYDDSGKWLHLKFIIDEGPRYQVRNVALEGVTKFDTQKLLQFLELKAGEYFSQVESNKDLNTLTDLYGSQGHVFADVQADLRFLEEPGQLDVVYRVKEGQVFKVGEINVHIAGEFPRTRQTVVLNRVSLRPGDIIDTREVRNSERRLKASQLFAGTQNDGEPPRIVVRPPELSTLNVAASEQPRAAVRGQEPEPAPARGPAVGNANIPAPPVAGPGSVWR